MIAQWISPELGKRKVADIRRHDIERLFLKVSAHRSKRSGKPTKPRANRVLALISTLMTRAINDKLREDNPAIGIKKNPEEPRSRYLKPDDEVDRLFTALADEKNKEGANAFERTQFTRLVEALLLTGCRLSELISSVWGQFDLDTGVWTKPATGTKQAREHRLPLSERAIKLFLEMRTEAQAEVDAWNANHIGKARRDIQSLPLFPRAANGRQPIRDISRPRWAALCQAAGITGLRPHDCDIVMHLFWSTPGYRCR